MPKVFTSKSQKIGELGENIATLFLQRRGYSIVERNYTKKCGEIDIVVQKDAVLHFVEVKSTVVISRDFIQKSGFRPEDQLHSKKIQRLRRIVRAYLWEKSWKGKWQVDVIVVFLIKGQKRALVRIIENIIL